MSCEHLIVSGPSEDATVLYDLDSDSETFAASVIDTLPPRRRRSWAASMMVDGAVEAASAYENREIRITMRPKPGATAQAQAEDMLTLHRLFANGGLWLRHRPEGVTAPVFYRLLPADIELTNYYETGTPDRDVTFVVPADPFGRGLRESGTATVVNDPTQSNGMRFTIPSVKGDVSAPLRLELSAGALRFCVAATTDATSLMSAAPVVPVTDVPFPLDVWEITEEPRSGTVSGTYLKLLPSTTASSIGVTASFPAVRPGEYRVFVRAVTNLGGDATIRVSGDARATQWPPTHAFTPAATVEGEVRVIAGSFTYFWEWVDCGVVRLPGASQISSSTVGSSDPVAATLRMIVSQTGSSWLGLDHVLLVPTPGADGSSGTFGRYVSVPTWTTTSHVVASEQDTYVQLTTGGEYAGQADGGFPRVTPGVPNMVTVLAHDVDLSNVTEVDYSYPPMYLYLRGD